MIINWLNENLVNILIVLAISALLYACIRSLANNSKSGNSCGCGKSCSSCNLCSPNFKEKLYQNVKGS